MLPARWRGRHQPGSLQRGLCRAIVRRHHPRQTRGVTSTQACSGRDIVAGWVHLPALPEEAAKDENLGMPSMTAELSTRAVLSVAASVVEGSKQGDISDAVKSRLLV